jgi:hypothetical protein
LSVFEGSAGTPTYARACPVLRTDVENTWCAIFYCASVMKS